jgi:CheY-like chemotaxis protein
MRKPIVMVVDDEPLIRETILEILREEGFEPIGISDGAAAVSWAQRIEPDVVLADVIMPGLNGVEMAITLRAKMPELRIMLFSGQAAAADLLERARAEGYEFELFPKPIRPDDLVAALRTATATGQQTSRRAAEFSEKV